jgi:hypothetical protein
LYIPDFEGQAILRLFSNSTQAEIGCFAAQITNGNSFRQKTEVGAVLGAFTLMAVMSSFAVAIYGGNIVEIRKHYAHSLSVMVVFAVWHHIYFSGAMSMNWPNVLVSFWSNYAWTGGMIYSEHMQNIVNDCIGSNKGNTSQVGAAGTGTSNPGLGGGYDIHAIYRRGIEDPMSGFAYHGRPVKPGLPIPGNFSGFAGTLAQEKIPASNAFMTCLLWSLTLIAAVIVFTVAFKISLEGLLRARLIKTGRLAFFRAHYVRYTAFAVLRAAFIGFFMMAFISMFQLSYLKSPGPVAVACVVILVVIFGIGTAAAMACYRRIYTGRYVYKRDVLIVRTFMAWNIIPWFWFALESRTPLSEGEEHLGTIRWLVVRPTADGKPAHEDEDFISSYGWIAARYRKTRWWFFTVWLVYEFIRASFLAGASSQPLVQVFGLIVMEFIAFVAIIFLRPFEGQRLNVLLVYLLGFSKLATTALSAAFDTRFNLARIPATGIGIIIIIIQSLLTVAVLVLIIIGAISSYFSITRNRTEIRPRCWMPTRERYFERVSRSQHGPRADLPLPIPTPLPIPAAPVQQIQNGPSFSVHQVQRAPKVEDEDEEFVQEVQRNASLSQGPISSRNCAGADERPLQRGRAASDLSQTSYSSLPRAARLHRPNWTSQKFEHLRGEGRARAASNAATSRPEDSSRASNRALPQSIPGRDNGEDTTDQSTSFLPDKNRLGNPASSLVAHPDDSEVGSSFLRQPESRPSAQSRVITRPPLETRITEEDIAPVFRKSSKASIVMVAEIE